MKKIFLLVACLFLMNSNAATSAATCKTDCEAHRKASYRAMLDIPWVKGSSEQAKKERADLLYVAATEMLAFLNTHCQDCKLGGCPANLKQFDDIVVKSAKASLEEFVKKYEKAVAAGKLVDVIYSRKAESAINSVTNLMPVYESKTCPTK